MRRTTMTMTMTTVRRWTELAHGPVVGGALLLAGCTETPSLPNLDDGSSTSTSGSSTSGADETATDDLDDEDPRLDLANDDGPNTECASVMQTTEIQEGPSDILLIADAGTSEVERTDALTNLMPYISHVGIDDAQVLWITGPAPMQADPECGESWICPPGQGPQSHIHIEDEVPAGSVLTALLDTQDQWAPHLRPDATKHVWVYSSTRRDDALSIDEFDASVSALGEGFEAYTFHVKLPSDDLAPVAGDDFRELAQTRGGHFYDPIDTENYNIELFFDEVLDRISAASLSCEYVIPEPPLGHAFDRDEVNVVYDDGLGPRTIGYVPSAADCSAVDAGWYYDDDDAPTQLIMCPNVCATFQGHDDASIEIQFGCATIPAG